MAYGFKIGNPGCGCECSGVSHVSPASCVASCPRFPVSVTATVGTVAFPLTYVGGTLWQYFNPAYVGVGNAECAGGPAKLTVSWNCDGGLTMSSYSTGFGTICPGTAHAPAGPCGFPSSLADICSSAMTTTCTGGTFTSSSGTIAVTINSPFDAILGQDEFTIHTYPVVVS